MVPWRFWALDLIMIFDFCLKNSHFFFKNVKKSVLATLARILWWNNSGVWKLQLIFTVSSDLREDC